VLQKDRQFLLHSLRFFEGSRNCLLEHTNSPPFFLVEQGLPILLEHTSSPPFFLEEQGLPILLEHTSSSPFFFSGAGTAVPAPLEKTEVNWCAPEG
jgi:hypothetical protein